MIMRLSALSGVIVVCALPAQAFEVTGGQVQLRLSAFTEESGVNAANLEGSVEFGLSRSFGLQADLGHNRFGFTDIDATNLGLHAIYHLSAQGSLGAFYAREDVEGVDVDLFGVEGGFDAGAFEFEGYLGQADSNGDDETILGISGLYRFDNGIGVSLGYDDIGDTSTGSFSRTALTIDRTVAQSVNLFVEVGSADVSVGGVSDSESFVGIGGRYIFGAKRGTTFNQRSLGRIIPGL